MFNGEIYNYVELRNELMASGVAFHTASDTEVLLAALDFYGIDAALEKLNGMFAFAWLCGRSGKLRIGRDRVGEKPLYYWRDGRVLAFASEIKGLLTVVPDKGLRPNRRVIRDFLATGVVDDSEETFFAGVRSLKPAHYAEIVEGTDSIEITAHSYWPKPAKWEQSRGSLYENAARCAELVGDAVRIRLRSDVPVGFLVSGGIDSSVVTALALKHGIQRDQINAFSVVNPSLATDETYWIDSITQHLDVPVKKINFDPDGPALLNSLERYVLSHDEPYSTIGILAHVEMMKAAYEDGVTVLLSGQGADELFCGYSKYFYFAVQSLLQERKRVAAMRLAWDFFRNGTVLQQFSAADAARYINLPLPGVARLPLGDSLAGFAGADLGLQSGSICDRQLADLLRFSVPSINHSEDRASMAFSREVRFPFFDWRVMEFALSLPTDQKIGDGWTKHVLRLAGEPMLPAEITWRKDKVGHFTASREWLARRSSTFENYLSNTSPVFAGGFLNQSKLMPRWKAFWAGGSSGLSVAQVISLLTLDMWLKTFDRWLNI